MLCSSDFYRPNPQGPAPTKVQLFTFVNFALVRELIDKKQNSFQRVPNNLKRQNLPGWFKAPITLRTVLYFKITSRFFPILSIKET